MNSSAFLRTLSSSAILSVVLSAPSFSFDNVQLSRTIEKPSGVTAFVPQVAAVSSTGQLWVLDSVNNRLLLFSAGQGEFVKSFGAKGVGPIQFQSPQGIAIDSEGVVYIADTGNNRIQVMNGEGTLIRTIGQKGSEDGHLNSPMDVAVTADGVVAVADNGNERIQLFTKDGIFLKAIPVEGGVTAIAADATGSLYTINRKEKQIDRWSFAGQRLKSYTGIEPGVKGFGDPRRIAVNTEGFIYVTDADTYQVREMENRGRTKGTFGRKGTGSGQFKSLEGVAVFRDNVFICDPKNSRIAVLTISRQEAVASLVPTPLSRLQIRFQESWPATADYIALAPAGRVALAAGAGPVRIVDEHGKEYESRSLPADLKVKRLSGLLMDTSATHAYVSDSDGNRVIEVDEKGTLVREVGKGTSFFKGGAGELARPQRLAFGTAGTLLAVDNGNGRLQAFNPQGLFMWSAGQKGSASGELKSPTGVASDKDRIFVADPGNRKVSVFNHSGRFIRDIGLIGPEVLQEPRQVAVDEEGHLYVLDAKRGRILVFDTQGTYLGGFGAKGVETGYFQEPLDFVIDRDGRIFVLEKNRVQVFRAVLLPPTPKELKALSGEGHVKLEWEAVTSRFPCKYLVYRSTPLGSPTLLKETVETSYIDGALVAEKPYLYSVVAQSIQGAMSVASLPIEAQALPLKSGPVLEIVSAQIDDVFSAYYKYYTRTPIGSVRIRNNSPVPLAKAKVSFQIQGFMDYPTEQVLPEVSSLEEKEVPLLATFNNRILEVTETTPIQAQIKLTYYQGEQEQVTDRHMPFTLFSRNSIRWSDKDRLAAFVTPNDPPVIQFARQTVLPFLEAHEKAPLPQPMIKTWALFAGLGTYGIHYAARPTNPYDRVSLDSSTVDSVQFARETLTRKSGDCADVVVLLSSMLESLSVSTVGIDIPGHLLIMFDTGVSDKSLLKFHETWLIPYAGTYWIPVEATMIGSNFMDAWKQGMNLYQKWNQQKKASFIDFRLAWRTYEPATLPETALGVEVPTQSAIDTGFQKDWKALLDFRWQAAQARTREAIAAAPDAGKPWLEFGFIALDFGNFDEAATAFVNASKDATTAGSAYNNLGNLAMLKNDFVKAESHYTRAISADPTDGSIYLNLARLYLRKKEAAKASEVHQKALALSPELRESYAELSSLEP